MSVIETPGIETSFLASRPLSADSLRRFGTTAALIADEREITYRDLADLVEQRGAELGTRRRLIMLSGTNDLDFVVTWLAALDRRHPVILAEGSAGAVGLASHYRPHVLAASGPDGISLDHLGDHVHEMHPDLAVLMSTSGSTGTPKLVRLSRDAIDSNAAAIATYLGLTPADRGITSLPLHYCYGLSVLSSHLSVGASVVLTNNSVVDPCFWQLVDRWRVTGLAGVPYTFDLVERVGIDVLSAPSLRYVTQAGGRLDPDRVLRLAEYGRQVGWSLYVMYGQTEATARIAYLPPDAVFEHPGSIGQPIPGGSITLAPLAGASDAEDADGPDDAGGMGEIVYRGPNVMMGYATGPLDLARGHEVDELHTGDLGRWNSAGLLEVVGRKSRFVKIHGKRVDLDHLELALSEPGGHVTVAGDDRGIVVAVEDPAAPVGGLADADLQARAAAAVSIPSGRVLGVRVPSIPRTGSDKIDRPALVETARRLERGARERETAAAIGGAGRTEPCRVAGEFRIIFPAQPIEPDSTFVSLGGDSFSYVEMSVRLEGVLGDLPMNWHLMTVSELESAAGDVAPDPSRRMIRIETSVVIRAIAIALIVCTHMRLYRLPGGAHTLLAVVGYNFARFQLTPTELPGRLRRSVASIARVAIPTSTWIGINMLLVGGYSAGALFLVNNYFGSPWRRDGRWQYWYFEAFVQIMIVLAVLFSVAAVRRLERRAPFAFALAILAAALAIRFELVVWGDDYNAVFRPHAVAFFVALGWCAHRASTTSQRLLVTALTVISTVGFFDQVDREWRIIVMIAALIWIPTLPLPALVGRVVAVVAAASMYIFLLHWQVWPLFTPWLDDRVAFVATMAVGVAAWWVLTGVAERIGRAFRRDDRAAAEDGRPLPTAEFPRTGCRTGATSLGRTS